MRVLVGYLSFIEWTMPYKLVPLDYAALIDRESWPKYLIPVYEHVLSPFESNPTEMNEISDHSTNSDIILHKRG